MVKFPEEAKAVRVSFPEIRSYIEFTVPLAGEKPGLLGKAKHLYQEAKGSGGNQQGGGGREQYQGRGDDLF